MNVSTTGNWAKNYESHKNGACKVKNFRNARKVVDNFKASVTPEKWHPCNYDINGTDPLG